MKNAASIKDIIKQMTLEEKAALCSGKDTWHTQSVERLGVPSLMVTDGPHGLRKQRASADHLGLFDSVPSTCFPSAAGVASSWNRALIEQMGEALGRECQAEEVAVLLGPGVNIKRSPLCGRNFEYFSEDPLLSSEMAAHHIKGVQSQGVGTSIKHFAANNQEHRRMTSDSVVDERTLREIYLASFEGAVKKSQPWTVMCSYNKVNGEFVSENETLLTTILKEEWGHEGIVVSDWGAVNDRVKGVSAGLELEMPSSNGEGTALIVRAVQEGKLSEEKLDQTVERLLTVIFKAKDNQKPGATFDPDAHHQLAREIARESMVLLKNEDSILPLSRTGKLALIGAMAKEVRYQGSGSSQIKPTRLEDISEEMIKIASDAEVVYAQGYQLSDEQTDAELLEEAKSAAASSDTAVIFAGLPTRYESEGFDRQHLRIPPNQIALIQEIANVQPNLVVVLSNGAPVEMPWLSSAKGVLEAYLGGQALGGAIADLLFGVVSPSGKLAETFPLKLSDNPAHLFFPGEGDNVEYREGIFVGYRYYDKKEQPVLFPFGHGLSYTSFDYTNLTVMKKKISDQDTLQVEVTVRNTGQVAGKEIVQLYVRDTESSVIRPDKELKAFDKVELQPGESRTITFTLDKRSFAYYDVKLKDWVVESGSFDILVGKSSQDIVLSEQVEVESTTERTYVYHRNSTITDLNQTEKGREWVKKIYAALPFATALEGPHAAMLQAFMKFMPIRGMLSFSAGNFTEEKLSELINDMNQQ